MTPITVSVITPCYNGAAFLRSTLESAASQTRPPLEIIVVDDGSTDASAEIAESFGPPVRVIRQPNQGESVARNRGVDEARGTHVAFLDADDMLAPESLERMAEALEGRPNTLALMGCAWFEDDPSAPYAVKTPEFVRFFPEIIESNLMPCHCWLAPRQAVLDAGGFLGSLQWFEDWDLWWRVGLNGADVTSVPYVGALYRRHRLSQLATTKLADQARGHARLMERMAGAFLDRPGMMREHGDQLFWSCWTALNRARAQGVPWRELRPLSRRLVQVAKRGPATVRSSRIARAARFLGPRILLELHARTTS